MHSMGVVGAVSVVLAGVSGSTERVGRSSTDGASHRDAIGLRAASAVRALPLQAANRVRVSSLAAQAHLPWTGGRDGGWRTWLRAHAAAPAVSARVRSCRLHRVAATALYGAAGPVPVSGMAVAPF
jgi:hypothetical protein